MMSMNKISAAFAAALMFFASPVCASVIDIDEAVRLTLENNADLRSLRQEIVKAYAFKVQSDAAYLPSLNAELSADRQRASQTSDGSERSSSRSATATLEQVIYSGGKNSALRAQAPQMKNIADAAARDGENSAAGEVYGRFYNVMLKKKEIEAEEAAVAVSEHNLLEVRKMAELGLANRLEIIRAEQQLASDTADLVTARGEHETAIISLLNYMAMEPDPKCEVVGELYEPEITGDREKSLALAEASRADLLELKEELNYQRNQIRIEKSAMRPTVTAGLSSGWENPYNGDDRSETDWRAELSISVPIFDRNVTRSAVISALAVLEQDRIALEQKEIDIKSDVETAWTEIETSLRSLRASEKALDLAKESLRLAQVGFREGVTPQLDLLEAQSTLTESQHEYNSALYDTLIAVVALKVTEGTIVEWHGRPVHINGDKRNE